MLYAAKLAWRYLASSRGQTALLIAGVALGVFFFVFISALIGGLGQYLVQRTVGEISHVTLTPPPAEARLLPGRSGVSLTVAQAETGQRDLLAGAEALIPVLDATPGVKGVSPQIIGNGILMRGQARAAVSVTGIEPQRVSDIANFGARLTDGNAILGSNRVLIGQALAEDLKVTVGQILRLQSDRGQERALQITGIYELGVDSVDRRSIFISQATARTLFAIPQGISRIEVSLEDLSQADVMAERLSALTGYKAESWTSGNAQLLDGLKAQERSGDMIKGFSLVTIVIGVASAMLVNTYRRSSEIGIMRATGARRGFVLTVFILQGALIGLCGGALGAGLGFAILSHIPPPEIGVTPVMPVDYRQGAYGTALLLTTIGAVLASLLPARAASRIDPVKVIGQ